MESDDTGHLATALGLVFVMRSISVEGSTIDLRRSISMPHLARPERHENPVPKL